MQMGLPFVTKSGTGQIPLVGRLTSMMFPVPVKVLWVLVIDMGCLALS